VPWVAGLVFCCNVPDGVDSDVVLDGVGSCGDDWFVVCGGAPALPAGRVTTVPFLGGKYNRPFFPQPTVKVSGKAPAKHNHIRFITKPAAAHAAPTTLE
jgi:hypothetical protein